MVRLLLPLAGPALVLGAVLIILGVQLGEGLGPMYFAGIVLVLLGVAGQILPGILQRPRQERPPLPIAVPVSGRWRGLNSPASKVPSHTHSLAQTYAIDITYEPVGASPRALDGLRTPMRRPEEFPSFGQPVFAPFDGVVLATLGTVRDHRTRLSPLGLIFMMIESVVRSLGTPRHLLGNHVLLQADGVGAAEGDADGGSDDTDSDDGGSSDRGGTDRGDAARVSADSGTVVAVLAHLRRGSLQVAPGDRVTAGQVLAECGNSGNSSDPHVHFQLMDGPSILTARGLPFRWQYRDEEGAEQQGVPANEELFTAEPPEPGHSASSR
jgi:hypothetical protein